MKFKSLVRQRDGATKKYAVWLVEETGYDCVETKNAKVANLQNYDVIILGGGVYASGIARCYRKQLLNKNRKNMSLGKKHVCGNIEVIGEYEY